MIDISSEDVQHGVYRCRPVELLMKSGRAIIAHPQTGKRHTKEFEHTEEAYS